MPDYKREITISPEDNFHCGSCQWWGDRAADYCFLFQEPIKFWANLEGCMKSGYQRCRACVEWQSEQYGHPSFYKDAACPTCFNEVLHIIAWERDGRWVYDAASTPYGKQKGYMTTEIRIQVKCHRCHKEHTFTIEPTEQGEG